MVEYTLYTFTLTCASDAGCVEQQNQDVLSNTYSVVDGVVTRASGGDGTNDLTNLTNANTGLAGFAFDQMCGCDPDTPDQFYTLTITHSATTQNAVQTISYSEFTNPNVTATYNCKDATSLNYVNTGTHLPQLCRYCDPTTGMLIKNTDYYQPIPYRTSVDNDIFAFGVNNLGGTPCHPDSTLLGTSDFYTCPSAALGSIIYFFLKVILIFQSIIITIII